MSNSDSESSSSSESESPRSARESPIASSSPTTAPAAEQSRAADRVTSISPERSAHRLPSVKRRKRKIENISGDELRRKLHPNFPKPIHSRLRESSQEYEDSSAHSRSMCLNTCSPGPVYYPNADVVRRHAPAVKLCAHDRFNGPNHYEVSRHSPGPVYYVETSWRKKPVSFSSSDRFLTRDDIHPSPGPTDYTPDDTKLSTKRSHKAGIVLSSCDRQMNATQKEDLEREEIRMRQELYEQKHGLPKAKKRRGTRIIGGPMKPGAPSTFGTPHHKEKEFSIGPGPAAYQTVIDDGKKRGPMKGATLNTSSRSSMTHEAQTVGTGHYSPNYSSILPRSPSPIIYYTS